MRSGRARVRRLLSWAAVLGGLAVGGGARAGELASGGVLRAVYLGSNPAQSMRDAMTGERRGASYELAQALARREGVGLAFQAVDDPGAVIEAVRAGAADIGFVAYEATRVGSVDFSQAYMLVRQSFVVPAGSSIQGVGDIDRAGRRVAGTRNDSITLCLKRSLRHAVAVEVANDPGAIGAAVSSGEVDAFGANRQRLTALMRVVPGLRMLGDDLFSVPQNVVVAKGRAGALAAVNGSIDEMRASGAMEAAIGRGGAVGVGVAGAGVRAGCPEP